MVGRGGFGDVFEGRLPDEYGGGKVAVKRYRQQNNVGELSRDAQQELRVVRMTLDRNGGGA